MKAKDPTRRKFPRRPFLRSVGILYKGKYLMTQGDELGEGGISFISSLILPINIRVVLSFQIPNGSFVSVQSIIKNHTPHPKGIAEAKIHGCQFIELPFDYKRQIRTYVSSDTEHA